MSRLFLSWRTPEDAEIIARFTYRRGSDGRDGEARVRAWGVAYTLPQDHEYEHMLRTMQQGGIHAKR